MAGSFVCLRHTATKIIGHATAELLWARGLHTPPQLLQDVDVVVPLRERPEIYGVLISMASVRAHSALDGWIGGHQPGLTRMALEAGVSAELVAKAFLAAHSPALLLPDRPSRDTLLHLTGLGHLATSPVHEIQTIGMAEAFRRVRFLVPDFSYSPERHRDLTVARNAIAHLGDVPESLVSLALCSMVRIHTEIGEAIGDWGTGEDFFEEYWDERADAVRHLLDESKDQGDRIALAKVATARLNFLRNFGRLEPADRLAMATTLAGHRGWAAAAEVDAECPACGHPGVLAFDGIAVGEPFQAPLWSTGEPATYVHQREQVLGFDCSVCGLALEGQQAAAAGLTWHIEMPDRLVQETEPGVPEAPVEP